MKTRTALPILLFTLTIILLLQVRPPSRCTFTWVDGPIDPDMASEISEAHFTDVALRRCSKMEYMTSIDNLHKHNIRAWKIIRCPENGVDPYNYFRSQLDGLNWDGYYIDDLQIVAETGGSPKDVQNVVNAALEILGEKVIFCAVVGWNGHLSPSEISQLYIPNFDYYGHIHINYLQATWPKTKTRGIYLWPLDQMSSLTSEEIEHIYSQAVILRANRIVVWQWYFQGEPGHPSHENSLKCHPELISLISDFNTRFLNHQFYI